MSILKYFKNIPRSPSHRATGSKFQICNEVPGEKKGGDQWAPSLERGRGACPPLGRPGYAPLYKLQPSPSLLI